MGYAGLAMVCAIALATSLHDLPPRESGRLLINWARNSWAFLTIGIGLGSWWAYYELGWGGWWFWDPVENSSLMPWLALAALVHSAAALRKKQQLQGWVLFLALLCLSLSLMGIFLVRSGLLTSVHAFALDKERGLFLLAIWLLCTLVGCVMLYLGYKRERKKISPRSRTFVLLLNNLLLLRRAFLCVCRHLLSASCRLAVWQTHFRRRTLLFASHHSSCPRGRAASPPLSLCSHGTKGTRGVWGKGVRRTRGAATESLKWQYPAIS